MLRAILAGLAIIAIIGPAAAAPKTKTKTQPPAMIDVSNERAITLKAFTLSTMGPNGKPVAKLAKPLVAGGKTRIRLASRACEYIARWEFEDAGDEAQVNLCSDPKIVLTD